MSGTLYLVATPIGNLEDITLRALRILRDEVSTIACEDTRRARVLLGHYGIEKELESIYAPREERKSLRIVKKIEKGENVALISDSGTPGISDPGGFLIKSVLEIGGDVVSIPGASALLCGLSASGLQMDEFIFCGFLPKKEGKKKKKLESMADERRTLVFYESPYRILSTLCNILEIFGDRRVAVCRELTKKFEEIKRGRISEIIEEWKNRKPKGEFVLIVEGKR